MVLSAGSRSRGAARKKDASSFFARSNARRLFCAPLNLVRISDSDRRILFCLGLLFNQTDRQYHFPSFLTWVDG